jgi:hypothetical protein
MAKEEHLLSRTLLSGWLPALVTVGAILATVANLVIATSTAPLAERISVINQKVLAVDDKVEDTKAWMERIEGKLDKVLLEVK